VRRARAARGFLSLAATEFVEFMSRGVIRCFPAEKLIEAFETLRTPNDRPGTISRRELSRTLMALLPEAVPNEEAAEKLVAHVRALSVAREHALEESQPLLRLGY
jgi:Ca2+-binding EF-hand superfamily protein